MECSRVDELAEAYGLGQLSHSTMSALEEHASHCPRCEAALLAATELGDEWKEALWDLAPAPAGLLGRVHKALPAQGIAEPDLCYALGPQISAMLDGELSGEDGLRVSEHLTACDGCARTFDAFAEQASALRALHIDPPARLVARIKRSIAEHSLVARTRPRVWSRVPNSTVSMAASVAAILVVFLAGWSAGRVWGGAGGTPSAAPASVDAGVPLVRTLPQVSLDRVSEAAAPMVIPSGTPLGSPSSSIVRVAGSASHRGSRVVAVRPRVVQDTPGRPAAAEPPAAHGPNPEHSSTDLIYRAWNGLIGQESRTAEAPAPVTEPASVDVHVVEAVTVQRGGGPVTGEYLEPAPSAVLY